MPAIFAAFSIIAGGTPSISIRWASPMKLPTQRLAKKPRQSLTTIGVFLIARTKSIAVASALWPVFAPMMISTSIIRSTGEKKWMPMKFSGFCEVSASEPIGSVEVLLAKITSAPRTACAFSVASFLTARSSNTASTTRSQPFRSA